MSESCDESSVFYESIDKAITDLSELPNEDKWIFVRS